jgi:protein phosphatase methylesterase 1
MPSQVIAKVNEATGITKYVWRTDLLATKPYWEQWFKGLTRCFLDVKLPK